MRRPTVQAAGKGIIVGLVAAALFVLAGCGGGDECADKTCDFGTCDAETGECMNAEECRVDEDCLPGYECGDEYTCEAATSCEEDSDCDVGVCEDEVCVNPSSCEEDDECLDSTYCDEGSCTYDPCNDTVCERGTCERGTGECVSADTCDKETEREDCAEGQKCADGVCADEDDFCDELDCERGECSFEEGECVNPDDCDGDDDACAEGYYCDSNDQCATDDCEKYDIDCGDNGVCRPEVGMCENADPCESNADCRQDHLCIDGECRLEELACGDADGDGGCPGNKTCVVEDDEAECEEPDECETSFDCDEGRQCGGVSCVEFASCVDDDYEPNDVPGQSVDLFEASDDQTLSGTLCRDDTDVFTFDSSELVGASAQGNIVVQLDVLGRSQGLGEAELTVTDAQGGETTETTGSMGAESNARFEQSVDEGGHGEYTIEVEPGEDLQEPGIAYDLSVALLPDDTIQACEQPETIEVGDVVSGDTSEAESNSLGSSCTDPINDSRELVYEVEVDRPQEVTFRAVPHVGTADLALSVQGRCGQLGTEVGCADETGAGQEEQLTTVLSEGTHYLVVQSPVEGSGGPFELEVDAVNVMCADGDNYCGEGGTSYVCSEDGGRFAPVECSSECDPAAGECTTPPGDRCDDAPVIEGDAPDEDQVVEVASESLNLLEAANRNEIESAEDGCLGEGDTQTDGPDFAYQVDLPAETGLIAEAVFDNEVDGSLYVVEDCGATDETCQVATNDSTDDGYRQELHYTNFDDEEETVYLVVDTAAGQQAEDVQVDLSFSDIICEPEAYRCTTDTVDGEEVTVSERCDSQGLRWNHDNDCYDWGCDDELGTCKKPDGCDPGYNATEDAEAGRINHSYTWDQFDNDLQDDICGNGNSGDFAGGDAEYEVDMEAGQRLYARLARTVFGTSPTLVMSNSCEEPGDACIDQEDDSSGPVSLTHDATEDETVYVIADKDNDEPNDPMEFNMRLMDPCDESFGETQCDGDALEFCDTDSYWWPEECENGCQDGACQNPTGDYCHEAIDATSDASQDGGHTYSGEWDDHSNKVETSLNCGDIGDSETEVQDHFYRVNLQDGETLNAEVSSTTPLGPEATVAILSDCYSPSDSCVAGEIDGVAASTSYTADGDQTVWVMADGYNYGDPAEPGDEYEVTLEIE